jgi:hypothetical protein
VTTFKEVVNSGGRWCDVKRREVTTHERGKVLGWASSEEVNPTSKFLPAHLV